MNDMMSPLAASFYSRTGLPVTIANMVPADVVSRREGERKLGVQTGSVTGYSPIAPSLQTRQKLSKI